MLREGAAWRRVVCRGGGGGGKGYWDERFTSGTSIFEEEHDWLTDFDGIEELLSTHLQPQHRVLVVGWCVCSTHATRPREAAGMWGRGWAVG
jgi:hypothetical protein